MVVRFSPVEAGEWDYLVNSNIAAWDGQHGTFTAAASDSKGFIHPAALHHWAYSEKANGLDQGHLWMGASEPRFAFLDDAAFRAVVDARAAQKFTHLRFPIFGAGLRPGAVPGPRRPQRRLLSAAGPARPLSEPEGHDCRPGAGPRPGDLLRYFPTEDQLRRFARYVAGRYAAMNVTWQAVEEFEGERGRAPVAEGIRHGVETGRPLPAPAHRRSAHHVGAPAG